MIMWPFRKKKNLEEDHKKRLEDFGPIAAVSSFCIGPTRLPILHGARYTPHNVSDSGWFLSHGDEPEDFRDYKLVPLESMISIDSTLLPLRDYPVGTEITRRTVTEPWRFIVDDKVVDEDGKDIGKCMP